MGAVSLTLDALRAGPSRRALRFTLIRVASQCRYNSTVAPNLKAPLPHPHAAIEKLSTELSLIQPCFGARGDEIALLNSPTDFYAKLINLIKRAKRRIIISTLYIGVEESELISTLRDSLKANTQLRCTLILDYHRSTRLSPSETLPHSTAHMLLPLIEEFPDRVEAWFFRSPKLKGLLEKIVPARYDEGWGTWHGKWYGVDDEVILSGANLASSYFTNRQDRYIHFQRHPSLLSYLSSLTRLFSDYSYRLSPSPPPSLSPRHLVPLPSLPSSSPNSPKASLVWPHFSLHPRHFGPHALATLTAFQNSWRNLNASRLRRVDVDTWFWPVVQAGVLGVREEERSLGKVWDGVRDVWRKGEGNETDKKKESVEVALTSGYFGLYKAYKKAVIDSPAPVKLIAASPKSNGFYGSAGLSRLIPEAYTLLESRFHRDAQQSGRIKEGGVRLREWERKGWTYHSKGIWLSPTAPAANPFFTFIGSSNLSTRSLNLDTELSLLILTSSPSLRKALGQELKALDEYAVDVGESTWKAEDRKVSWLCWALVALGVEGML
ncbi:hypothetical protein P7C73_g3679, partial [Tremellales sp. Uapishka_1]